MIEDLVLDDDDSAQRPEPAFYTFPPVPAERLLDVERCYRLADNEAAKTVLFTSIDEDGAETWDTGQGERWQRLMRWPIEPTIAEAQQYKAHKIGVLLAESWDALRRARSGAS